MRKILRVWVDCYRLSNRKSTENNPIARFFTEKIKTGEILKYKATGHLLEKLKTSKYDNLYVDRAAKELLDQTAAIHRLIRESQFLQDLDDISTTAARGRFVKMLEREMPNPAKVAPDYDLIVLANPSNIEYLRKYNKCLKSKG